MALLTPPMPPPIGYDGDDRQRHLRLRLTQAGAAIVTILATCWFCSFGPIPGILALMVAKHVLVAVVMMGLGME